MTWPLINPPAPPPAEDVSFYRGFLETHANDPVTQLCRTCGVHRCQAWRSAFLWLIDAGQLPDGPTP